MSLSTSTSTPPRPNATSLPKLWSLTAPTITSCAPVGSICCTCTPLTTAPALYFFAFATIVSYPARTACASATPTSTPPASVLCKMSGETILSTTG